MSIRAMEKIIANTQMKYNKDETILKQHIAIG